MDLSKLMNNNLDTSSFMMAISAYMARTQWLMKVHELVEDYGKDETECKNAIEALSPGWWIWLIDSVLPLAKRLRKSSDVNDETGMDNTGNFMVDMIDDMCIQYFTDEKAHIQMQIEYTMSDAYEMQMEMDGNNGSEGTEK